MSPALRGRRAVITLLSLFTVSYSSFVATAQAAGPHAVPPAPVAPPRLSPPPGAPQPAPVAQRPVVQPHHGGQQTWQRHWRRPDGPQAGVIGLPATFRPSATWRQQHFHQPNGLGGPQVIYAPAAAATFDPPLELTQGEPSLDPQDYYAEPCVRPLIIHIGTGAQQESQNGVRVIHAQSSACGSAQVVRYTGPRVIETTPAPGAKARKPGKRAAKGFQVVRARM